MMHWDARMSGHTHTPVPNAKVIMQRVPRFVDVSTHWAREGVLYSGMFVSNVYLEV